MIPMIRYALATLVILTLAGCGTQTESPVGPTPTQEMSESVSAQRLLVLGDSLTAGYQLAYEDSYPAQVEMILRDMGYDILVINGGESGDTSA
jgi:lysophospholipase L1-like esterase